MPKNKKISSGRYSIVFPGLLLGNKSSVQELMSNEEIELLAVVNIGGGKSYHPNTLKFHLKDSSETSMLHIFEDTCKFIDTYCNIVVYPSTSRIEMEKEFSKFRDRHKYGNEASCACDKKAVPNAIDSSDEFSKSDQLRVNPPIIEKSTKNKFVLVHCQAGMHRSPTIVCAYLIYCGYGVKESLDFIKEKRVVAIPTPSQVEDLACWEKLLRKQEYSDIYGNTEIEVIKSERPDKLN